MIDGAFEKKWLPWRALYFDLKEDATLTYTKFKGSKGVHVEYAGVSMFVNV